MLCGSSTLKYEKGQGDHQTILGIDLTGYCTVIKMKIRTGYDVLNKKLIQLIL
jgi:hypothetical protein